MNDTEVWGIRCMQCQSQIFHNWRRGMYCPECDGYDE